MSVSILMVHTVNIYRQVGTRGEYGGHQISWKVVNKNVPCRVNQKTSVRNRALGSESQVVDAVIYFDENPRADGRDILAFTDDVGECHFYKIYDVENPQELNLFYKAFCIENQDVDLVEP